MVELDDDVVNAPPGWSATLQPPSTGSRRSGFSPPMEDDPNDEASQWRHRIRARVHAENGVRLLTGPAGRLAITSRALSDRVGGFREGGLLDRGRRPTSRRSSASATGRQCRVHHTGGSYYTQASREKEEHSIWAKRARRDAVKRTLVRLPFVRILNARFGLFVAPS